MRLLSPEDIRELKSVKVPNANTEITLNCVLAYFGYSELNWANAQKAMTDINFLKILQLFDKELIS